MSEEDYGDSLSLRFGSGYGGGKKAWEDLDDPFTDDDFGDAAEDFPDFDGDAAFADGDGFIEPAKKAAPKVRPARVSKFKPGDLVRHPLFGSGKVLTVDRGKIMVQFFASGTRLLNEDLAQLSKG